MGTRVVTADEARKKFADLLNSASYGNDRIQIERRGKVIGFIIGPKDMKLLESAREGDLSPKPLSSPSSNAARGAANPPGGAMTPAPVDDETISWDELEEEL